MSTTVYLNNVTPSRRKKIYPSSSPYSDSRTLEKKLQSLKLNIRLGNTLKGGYAAQVYAALLDNRPVVVKHTEHLLPFDPTEFVISDKMHAVDTAVLKKLSHTNVRVPKILHYFPQIKTTIMEDMRENGYELLSDQILSGKLDLRSAPHAGKTIVEIELLFRKWKHMETNESSQTNIYERGFELRFAYPNTQQPYLLLEKEYMTHDEFLVWPDAHPKNIFINSNGEVCCIDFGRAHYADQRYMLPNFLAHIVLYSLAGYIPSSIAQEYIRLTMKSYTALMPVDERIFCRYLAMEVLHRANGKWVQGIETREQKISAYNFGLMVFDGKIATVNALLQLLK